MNHAIFCLPYGLDATLRFVRAALRLPDARIGLVTQESTHRLPEDVRDAAAAIQPVSDALDADALTAAVRACARTMGGRLDRIFGILEPMQETMAEVRRRLDLPGMTPEVSRNFRDKAHMKDLLRAHDLPCARHALAGDVAQALAFGEHSGYPMVVKPPDGAGAKNTYRVNNAEELRQALTAAPPSATAPVLLEEFVQGREHSFDTVSIGGRHVLHSVSEYTPTPLEVMQTPWIQWCVLLPRHVEGDEYADIHAAGARVLDVLGMETGLTHMEWFRRPDGSLAISEVAARPPGAQFTSLLSYAHDLDFYRAWAELMVFDRFHVPTREFAAGAAYLRGQGHGRRVVAIHGLDEARKALGDLVVDVKLPQEGQAKAESYEGEGYVILRHPDTDVVRRGLQTVVQTIRVELA